MANTISVDSRTVKHIVTSLRELKKEVSSLKKMVSGKILTENGFTPEFESRIIVSAKEPKSESYDWNGKGSFSESVLKSK